jgi:aminoglycoside phosphotransferase
VGFWRPYVAEILDRHDLRDTGRELEAGFNPTYPTFLQGDVVVKLFGGHRAWGETHAAERAAHALVVTDPAILAPRILAAGRLFDHDDAAWPYLVTARAPGLSWRAARPTNEDTRRLAAALGDQVRRVHALRPSKDTACLDMAALDVAAAARESSLPSHLARQVDDFLSRLGPLDPVFVHGDLCATHVFVGNGRITGIIDWGDAIVADRHYELIQIHRDTFGCDPDLLRVFLEAAHWPVGEHVARQALGHALYRQATGLTQHLAMDVFEPVAKALPLEDIATLDELATALFSGRGSAPCA